MPTPNGDTRLSASRFRTNEARPVTSPAGVVIRVRQGQKCNAFRREDELAGMQSFSRELRQGIVIAERERFPVQKNRLVLEVFGREGVAFRILGDVEFVGALLVCVDEQQRYASGMTLQTVSVAINILTRRQVGIEYRAAHQFPP